MVVTSVIFQGGVGGTADIRFVLYDLHQESKFLTPRQHSG